MQSLSELLVRWRAELNAGAARVGWKLGMNFPEVEAVIGARPVLGYLTTATRLPAGGRYVPDADAELRAETELAVQVARDVSSEEPDVRGAIAAVAVALELVDVTRPPDELEGIVRANAFHRAFALGELHAPPRGSSAARLLVNGEVRESAETRSDHAECVRASAQLLESVGEQLSAEDFVLTGAAAHVRVAPGDVIRAEIDGLGSVEVSVS